jgi:5-methylcytosine-specific restriction endonuclease McrA
MRNLNSPAYKRWRATVFKRDKYTCKMPDCKSKKGIEAHHIVRWADSPPLRFEPSNGITLCQACHLKVTGCEESYASLFREIVQRATGDVDLEYFIRIQRKLSE